MAPPRRQHASVTAGLRKGDGRRAGPELGAVALALLVLTACSGSSAPRSPTAAGAAAVVSTPADSPSAQSGSHAAGRLAFGRFVGAGVSMFTENADGTDLKPLSPETGGEGPRFSPDGHRIAFALTIHDRVVGVVINADGTGYHAFAPPKGTLNMPCTVWSPDARRLACEGFDDKHPAGEGMYTVEAANGGDVRRVTNHHDIPCAYSPDGAQLLFLRYNPADETRNQLMVVNAKGGTPRLIRKDVDLSCDWSPDGKHLLSEAEGKLLLIDLRGASTVIPIAIRKASRGSFSPDGKHLIFSGSVGDKEDIYTVNIDGSELVQITSTPSQDEEFGDWGPGAVS